MNALDFSVFAFLVRVVDKNVNIYPDGAGPGMDELERLARKSYDPEIYDGAHVYLQDAGR
jgi:hypothetical protein